MSKTRYIKTDFWSDSFIESLDPAEKLLFIYLFTNDRLDLCGIYEITIRKISFETWINEDRVQKIISKFSEKWKIHYIEWYICVMNFTKHLQMNPSVVLGIERSKNLIPKPIIEALGKLGTGCIQGDTLIPIPWLIPIPEPIPLEVASTPNPNEIYFDKIQNDTDSIIDSMNVPDEQRDNARRELFKFWNYWTEKDMRGKERWRKEKTFEVQRRLTTWLMNTKFTKQTYEKPKFTR